MAGKAFGIGNHKLAGFVAKDLAQGVNFSRGASATGRSIGLVRDKHGMRGDLVPIDTGAGFSLGNQFFHHHADMVDVKPGAVEGTVGGGGAEHFANRRNAAFA